MRPPTPDQIRAARDAAGLTQTAAALLVHSTLRTWQDWERGIARMSGAHWELFLLKTGITDRADMVIARAAAG